MRILVRAVADAGDPAAAVGGLADQHARDDEVGWRVGLERQRADRDRADPVDLAVVVDRGEERGDLLARHAGGHAAAGDAHTVTDEQVAVAAGDVVQVELLVEADGDGAHGRSLRTACRGCR